MSHGVVAIKRGLIVFWSAWLSVVVATNLLDVLRAVGGLSPGFPFASGNWGWINQTMNPLGVPRSLQAFLYAGAIAWEAAAAALFWRAALRYRARELAREPAAVLACGVNLGLWGAFQVLDEVFMAYQPEAVHRAIFLSQLGTLLALHLLPSSPPDQAP